MILYLAPTKIALPIFVETFEPNLIAVADPGFPVGGGGPTHWGAPTSDAYTFWQKCMQKRKKLILLGGGGGVRAGGAPPWIRQWIELESCIIT